MHCWEGEDYCPFPFQVQKGVWKCLGSFLSRGSVRYSVLESDFVSVSQSRETKAYSWKWVHCLIVKYFWFFIRLWEIIRINYKTVLRLSIYSKPPFPFSGLYPCTEDHVIHTKYKDSVSQHHTNFVFRHVMKLVKVPFRKNIFSLLPNLFQLPWKVKMLLLCLFVCLFLRQWMLWGAWEVLKEMASWWW